MVVEDEAIVAADIQLRLEKLGYHVLGCYSRGDEAVHWAMESRPDLILMDIKLEGDMDGIEAAERIRQTQHIPIIFVTAFADNETLERAKITEPFGYILKPFDERNLHTTIEISLYKHRTQQRLLEQMAELRIAKEMAEQSDRLKDAFLQNMTHEIRTPLNIILGFSDVLRFMMHEKMSEHERYLFENIDQGGRRLMRTIDHILQLSKLHSGYIVLNATEFNLNAYMMELCIPYEKQASEKGVEFGVELDPEPQIVIGDHVLFAHALCNLLDNAVSFTDKGYIRIRLTHTSDCAQIDIVDQGSGISEQYLSNLFRIFSQENDHITRSHEGLGLGLTISKRFIELNNGRISISSKKLGGTSVTILFPLARDRNHSPGENAPFASLALPGLTVLPATTTYTIPPKNGS